MFKRLCFHVNSEINNESVVSTTLAKRRALTISPSPASRVDSRVDRVARVPRVAGGGLNSGGEASADRASTTSFRRVIGTPRVLFSSDPLAFVGLSTVLKIIKFII